MLADNGIAYLEIEMLLNWFVTDARRDLRRRAAGDMLPPQKRSAPATSRWAAIRAGGEFDPDHMAKEFRTRVPDAADAGTKVAFEPMPFVNVSTPAKALEFIGQADHPSGGVLLDIWHVARAGVDVTSVASVPARWIMDVELDDAPLHFNGTMDEMRADTFNGRRLPGQGELDVQGFVDAIKSTGYDGIWGVEILSAEYRTRPIEEAIPDAYRTTVQYLR